MPPDTHKDLRDIQAVIEEVLARTDGKWIVHRCHHMGGSIACVFNTGERIYKIFNSPVLSSQQVREGLDYVLRQYKSQRKEVADANEKIRYADMYVKCKDMNIKLPI